MRKRGEGGAMDRANEPAHSSSPHSRDEEEEQTT